MIARNGVMSVSRRYMVGVAVLVLAACNATAPNTGDGFRDPGALIGATSRFDEKRFVGEWHVRAAFPGDQDLSKIALVRLSTGNPAFRLVKRTCKVNDTCKDSGEIWRARMLGQGRYALDDPSGGPGRQLWVLWVDEGFRTAVVGTPSGHYGWILDRSTTGGADRIKAARELLDFNGYDVSQLQVRK